VPKLLVYDMHAHAGPVRKEKQGSMEVLLLLLE
jgi:hypothetical protein